MRNDITAEFLDEYTKDNFIDNILSLYEPLECLKQGELSDTYLMRQKDVIGECVKNKLYIAKRYQKNLTALKSTETDIIKSLKHDGLPKFIGEYENEEELFVVREYIEGIPLDELLQKKPLDEKDAILLAIQLCDILAYLHGQVPPIIHRDIKPSNIIVNQNRLVLIDFGISRKYDETLSRDTHVVGTVAFAPPEQYGFSQSDNRTDIYAFGVLLCYLLTQGTDIKDISPTVKNKKLLRIIKKCTAFSPKERYSNILKVRKALLKVNSPFAKRLAVGTLLVLILVSVFFMGFAAGRYTDFQPVSIVTKEARVNFKEPIIEKAIRVHLNKDEEDVITEKDLLQVTELFIRGTQPVSNAEEYYALNLEIVTDPQKIRDGSISDLSDLAQLKNLKTLMLSMQNISDITPLAGMDKLECFEIKHSPELEDISILSSMPLLKIVCLYDTAVMDLSPLAKCPRLTNIDVGRTHITSLQAIEGMEKLEFLNLSATLVTTLDGIEAHVFLHSLDISELHIKDLSPLMILPNLSTVYISNSMNWIANALENPHFEVIVKK